MTPAEIKAECERIWKEEPLAFAFNRAGWLLSINNSNQRKFWFIRGKFYLFKGLRIRFKIGD